MHQHAHRLGQPVRHVQLPHANDRDVLPPDPPSCFRGKGGVKVGRQGETYTRHVIWINLVERCHLPQQLAGSLKYLVGIVVLDCGGSANTPNHAFPAFPRNV